MEHIELTALEHPVDDAVDAGAVQDRLITERHWLTENLVPGPLLRWLRRERVMQDADVHRLEALHTEEKQVEALLDRMARAPSDAILSLLRGLKASHQGAALRKVVQNPSDAAVPQTAATSMYDVQFLRDNAHHVTDNLRFEGGFLSMLVAHHVISEESREELERIPERSRAAERLVRVVLRGADDERLDGLVLALKETGQRHIVKIITEQDTEYLLTAGQREFIMKRRPKYALAIVRSRFCSQLAKMVAARVITEAQKEVVEAYSSKGPQAQAEELVNILMCRPLGAIEQLPGRMFKIFKSMPNLSNNPQLAINNVDSDEDNTTADRELGRYTRRRGSDSAFGSVPVSPTSPLSPALSDESEGSTATRPHARLLTPLDTSAQHTEVKQRLYGSSSSDAGPVTPDTASSGVSSSSTFNLTASSSSSTDGGRYARRMCRVDTPSSRGPPSYSTGSGNLSGCQSRGRRHLEAYLADVRRHAQENSTRLNETILSKFGLPTRDSVFYVQLHLLPGTAEKMERGQVERVTKHDAFAEGETRIELQDIFREDADGRCEDDDQSNAAVAHSSRGRRYLLLGVAGSGKSTFSQYSAEQWGAGKLWDGRFRAVFLLQCRRLNYLVDRRKSFSLMDLLLQHGPPVPDPGVRRAIEDDLSGYCDHLLVIIDGLDELSGWEQLDAESAPEVHDVNCPADIPVLIHNIIAGNLFRGATFLFTSRPMDSIKSEHFCKTIRIFGFGRQSIKKCILAICENRRDMQKMVLDYLDKRPHLYYFCNVPISCIMTGKIVYDELDSGNCDNGLDSDQLNCATDLYISVLLKILESRDTQNNGRGFGRLESIIAKQKPVLEKMMKLASYGVLRRSQKLVFSGAELAKHGIVPADLVCGLLDMTHGDHSRPEFDKDVSCSFIHFSVQEFLTAVHVGLTWKKADLKSIIKKNTTGTHQFDLVIMYLSGLLGNPQGHRLLQALGPGLTPSKLTKRLNRLFRRIVGQYQGWLVELWRRVRRGGRERNDSKLLRLWVVRCVAESNARHLVGEVDELVLQDGHLDVREMPGGLHPQHMPAIAFYLQHSSKVTSISMDREHAFQLMRMINEGNKSSLVPLLDPNTVQDGRLNVREHDLNDDNKKGLVTYVLHTDAITAIDINTCVWFMRRIDEDTRDGLVALLDRCALTPHTNARGEPVDACLILPDSVKLDHDDVTAVAEYVALSRRGVALLEPASVALRLMGRIEAEGFAHGEELAGRLNQCVLTSWSDGRHSRCGRLDLSEIEDDFGSHVAGLAAFLRRINIVYKLDLEGTSLNDQHLETLCSGILPNCAIEVISMCGTSVSNDGVSSHLVGCVRQCQSIKEIDLRNTNVTLAGERALLGSRLEEPSSIRILTS